MLFGKKNTYNEAIKEIEILKKELSACQYSLKKAEEEIEIKNEEMRSLLKKTEEEIEIKNKEMLSLQNDLASELKIKNNEIDTKISIGMKEKNDRIAELEKKNAVNLKQIEILEEAFKNIGFDVKDMKSILDKLVEGIVGKNTVNIVK